MKLEKKMIVGSTLNDDEVIAERLAEDEDRPGVGEIEEPGRRGAHAVEQPPAGRGAQDDDGEGELQRGAGDDRAPVDAATIGREAPGDREEGEQPEYALQLLHRGSRSARGGLRPSVARRAALLDEDPRDGRGLEAGERARRPWRAGRAWRDPTCARAPSRRCRRSGSRSTRSWRSRTARRSRSRASARRARRGRSCSPSRCRRRTRWRRS